MAPIKRGDPRNHRVQAIDKNIGDLVLKGGEQLRVKVGGAILPTPTLKRGTGNSSIELIVHDPKLRWLKLELASEKWDAQIDGLWFRYLGTSKQGKQLTLRFEDRDVARLRDLEGPKKVYARRGQKNETTRAEFIVSLVRELKGPKLKVVCPQLHDKQPIATREQGEEAKEAARTDRGKGVGDTKGLTVKGEKATSEQIDVGDRALRVAEHLNAPSRVKVALMEALIVESLLGKVASNYLQLISSTAAEGGIKPSDLEAAVDGFLTGYINGEGGALAFYRQNPGAAAHEIAQAVQRSGAGLASNGAGNYGPWEDEAREWVEAFEGAGGPSSEEVTEPFTFEVGKKESYWQAIQRLAKEVNWRAFIANGTFYYISEPELARSQVRLAIECDEDGAYSPAGIEEVDFDFNVNKANTTATVTAFVKKWGAPPGSVVTLEGFGPASIGFGDAPVKADKKGRRQGVSSPREAKTGVGKGRYLVTNIETPLTGDSEARLATIEVRKPTAPLPEPRAETRTVNAGGAGGDTGGMGSLDGTPEDVINRVVEYANGRGFDVTPESVRAANNAHGPTISGSTSDHQGPPNVRWAADISNGSSPTPEMDSLAAAIAEAFGIPWNGSGAVTHSTGGFRFQLIYRTDGAGIGNHYNHVHIGCGVE
ncbi:MAG TPA: hypothetical protein VFW48_02765 [Solirubrobacterales bacterium]|nr:hypothetical protein [Solirubrobacterales bacterium]